MSNKLKLAVSGTVIGLCGYGLLIYYSHWSVALGVFLINWAQNIDHRIN